MGATSNRRRTSASGCSNCERLGTLAAIGWLLVVLLLMGIAGGIECGTIRLPF